MKIQVVTPFKVTFTKKLFILTAMIFFLSGCVLAPVLESVSKAGVTRNDRKSLLASDVKSFNQAMYWGNLELALKHVAPPSREEVTKELLRRKKEERVVESKIEALVFSDDAYTANVTVVTRYFKVPIYVVTDRNENQSWEFSLTSGWQLVERK